MKRYQSLYLALAAAGAVAAAGCGDNSKECGPGTMDVDGVCTSDGTGNPVTCTDGTVLNATMDGCVVSDDVCQGGDVLINNQCVPPTITADVNEGAEPNGRGIGAVELEASTNGAGDLTIKPVGETLVVKGVIDPFQDDNGDGDTDPDVDTYTVTASGPTLLEISADGTNGIAASFFLTVADPAGADPADPLALFQRYGLSITSDTAKRFVYLPAAGDYWLTVADTRSLYIGNDSPPAAGLFGAAGGPDSAYYLSITAREIPAPTALTVTAGVASADGELAPDAAPAFYSLAAGQGFNDIQLEMLSGAAGAFVVSDGTTLRLEAVEDTSVGVASANLLGGSPTTVIAVDPVYNYGPNAAPYTLSVALGTAGALSTTGGMVSQPEDDELVSLFYYDVATADELTGIKISFNQPVLGLIADANGNLIANLSFDPSAGYIGTFESYTGLVRHPAPGRYFVFAGDPDATGPTEIVATSTITAITPAEIVKGTELTGQAVNTTFEQNGFNYAAGVTADPWQLFNATGTGTGTISVRFYDPATAYGAFGSLGDFVDFAGDDPVPDALPKFTKSFPAAGDAEGRILIADAVERFLVIVDTATVTGTPTVNLDFEARPINDLGTLAAGGTASQDGETITAAAPVQYYLFRTSAANAVAQIAVDPDTLVNTAITRVDANEAPLVTYNDGSVGAVDNAQILQAAPTYIAFTVSTPTGIVLADSTFDVDVTVGTFTPVPYVRTAGTTAFTDIGSLLTEVDFDGETDDGLSVNTIASPTGFDFFGYSAPTFTVSTNGWLTFGPAGDDSIYINATMPTAGGLNALVAPAWDDYSQMTVYSATVGTTTIVQWEGREWTSAGNGLVVQFQVILDGADDSIEFVYGPNHLGTGVKSTVGVEDQAGGTASLVGFNTANTTLPNTSYLFTRMP